MGNDGLPNSIVILISVIFVLAIAMAGLVVYIVLTASPATPAA